MSFITVLLIYLVGVVLAYFVIGIGNYLEKYDRDKTPTWTMYLSWVLVVIHGIAILFDYFPKPEKVITKIVKIFKK